MSNESDTDDIYAVLVAINDTTNSIVENSDISSGVVHAAIAAALQLSGDNLSAYGGIEPSILDDLEKAGRVFGKRCNAGAEVLSPRPALLRLVENNDADTEEK